MSNRELSRKSGVSEGAIRKYLHPEKKSSPSEVSLKKISEALGVEPQVLLGYKSRAQIMAEAKEVYENSAHMAKSEMEKRLLEIMRGADPEIQEQVIAFLEATLAREQKAKNKAE